MFLSLYLGTALTQFLFGFVTRSYDLVFSFQYGFLFLGFGIFHSVVKNTGSLFLRRAYCRFGGSAAVCHTEHECKDRGDKSHSSLNDINHGVTSFIY